MRTRLVNAALEVTISRERLAKYLAQSGDILDAALSLYERNTKLSEAFYTPIQCFEITLRNAIHNRMSGAYGADWLDGGCPHLGGDAIDDIAKARRKATRPGKPAAPGGIVAELNLGFWVGLLGPRYDATIWREALSQAFHERGSRMARSRVHGRVNMLRRFRNRVAHHEPIFDRDLSRIHDEIIEAVGWICPETAAWCADQSRVAAVLAAP